MVLEELTTENTLQELAKEKLVTDEKILLRKPLNIAYDSKNRFVLLDNLRGLLILLVSVMIIMYRFPFIHYFMGHVMPTTNGIGFADFGVPGFIFMLCMMMSYNFKRNLATKGAKSVVKTYIIRSIALVGISFIMGYFASGAVFAEWTILATYGLASLFLLAFMPIKKPEIRFGIGMGIMLVYTIVLTAISPSLSDFVPGQVDGAIIGVISYIGLMLVCTAFGELYFVNKKRFYFFGIIIGALATVFLILRFTVPAESAFMPYIFISKHYQSISFMTIALAAVIGLFMLADKWKFLHRKKLPILNAMGQNTLLFFVVGGIFSQLSWVAMRMMGLTSNGDKVLFGENAVGFNGWEWIGGNVGHMFIALAIMMIPLIIMAYLFQRYKVRLSF